MRGDRRNPSGPRPHPLGSRGVRFSMKWFITLFTFLVAVTYVAGDLGEVPKGNCNPPELAAQMVMHCGDKRDGDCCEAVVASLDTGELVGQDLVPCFCSVTDELLPYSAFISTEDVINLYFACDGTGSRAEIEQTVASCKGGVLAPSSSPPPPN